MFALNLVILTKSSKHHKFCVAGIDLDSGKWVRLVSDNKETHGAISEENMQTKDRYIFEPLDVACVPIVKPMPVGCQTENYLIDSSDYWVYKGRMAIEDVVKLCKEEPQKYIFQNTKYALTEEMIQVQDRSLVLAGVTNLIVYKNEDNKTKCSFQYNGYTYEAMSVTDPDYYSYSRLEIPNAYIVVSLPDVPHSISGKYFKFIAKIFPYTSKSFTEIIDENPFSITKIALSKFVYFDTPVSISKIVGQINSLRDDITCQSLRPAIFNNMLVEIGLLAPMDINGKTYKLPTRLGSQIGICIESGVSDTGQYYIAKYNQNAQKYIVENLLTIIKLNTERE